MLHLQYFTPDRHLHLFTQIMTTSILNLDLKQLILAFFRLRVRGRLESFGSNGTSRAFNPRDDEKLKHSVLAVTPERAYPTGSALHRPADEQALGCAAATRHSARGFARCAAVMRRAARGVARRSLVGRT